MLTIIAKMKSFFVKEVSNNLDLKLFIISFFDFYLNFLHPCNINFSEGKSTHLTYPRTSKVIYAYIIQV